MTRIVRIVSLLVFGATSFYGIASYSQQTTGDIYTFAGGAAASSTANLAEPKSVAGDQTGNVYIADSGNSVIWKYSKSTSTFSVVAGIIGVPGNANGPLGVNTLFDPEGVAVDGAGNVYISDTGNNEIRVLNSSGGLSTLISSGLNQPAGIAVDSQTGTATYGYLADKDNNVIWKITLSTGAKTVYAGSGSTSCINDGSPATSGCLNQPLDVALDPSGNLYVADSGHCLIRRVASGAISTFAGVANMCGNTGDGGSPTSGYIYALGVAVDLNGNVFIGSDTKIREVSSSIISTLVGTGAAGYTGDAGLPAAATLGGGDKQGMTFDSAGTFYIADEDNNAVRDIYLLSPPPPAPCTAHTQFVPTKYLVCTASGVTNPSGPLSSTGGLADLYSAKTGPGSPKVASCSWSGFQACTAASNLTLTIDTVLLDSNDIEPYAGTSNVSVRSFTNNGVLISWTDLNDTGGPYTVTIPAGTDLSKIFVAANSIACNATGCSADTQVGFIHIN